MNVKYLINELWLPIRGYEGLYEISSYGRVRSLNYRNKGIRKVLSCHARQGYYIKVALVKNGVPKYYRVHRLVAQAFLPPPSERQTQVEHNELTRFHLSMGHSNPSPETRRKMSEGQKRRFAREREMKTGRYAIQNRASA